MPVEGEVSSKQRPKRKCLQWHPLLSKKKVLDFSEEEEEEDEEELEKVPSVHFGPVCNTFPNVFVSDLHTYAMSLDSISDNNERHSLQLEERLTYSYTESLKVVAVLTTT